MLTRSPNLSTEFSLSFTFVGVDYGRSLLRSSSLGMVKLPPLSLFLRLFAQLSKLKRETTLSVPLSFAPLRRSYSVGAL